MSRHSKHLPGVVGLPLLERNNVFTCLPDHNTALLHPIESFLSAIALDVLAFRCL